MQFLAKIINKIDNELVYQSGSHSPEWWLSDSGQVAQFTPEYSDASNEERLRNRQESVAPLVDAYFSWLGSIDTTAMDKSGKLYKAIQYSLNQEEFLRRFLEDPIIPLDNNDAERSIRKFCVGKHSWHIVSTPDGATASAAMYSIVETAKANGLRPYEYVKYVLEQLLEGTDIKILVP